MYTLLNYGSPFERRNTFASYSEAKAYVDAVRKQWGRSWEPLALQLRFPDGRLVWC